MRPVETLAIGGDRFRVRPWSADPTAAALSPLPSRDLPRRASIEHCVNELSERGYTSVVTSALSPSECQPFRNAGFHAHHELHLLARQLQQLPSIERRRLRRAKRRDWPAVLKVDARAFNPFWRFDTVGLEDALTATPSRRFRVVRSSPITGYHISGLAGTVGYLQRLAVDPESQGHGIGSLLLGDALVWMARRGATVAYVNTQVGNDAALALYERRGFVQQHYRLTVLTRALTTPAAGDPGRTLRHNDTTRLHR